MRNIVSCIVIFIILVSAVGMAEYEDEILFRGLDWNINAVDFLNAVLADANPSVSESVKWRLICEWNSLDYFDAENEFMANRAEVSSMGACAYDITIPANEDFYVAGYPVKSVIANAVSTVENARVMTGAENSRMVRSYYMFDHTRIDDIPEAYNDLQTKLTNLYGKFDLTKDEYDGMHRYHVWYGANSTFVMLHGQWHDGKCVLFDVTYGITNTEELLDHLQNPKVTINPNDTNGL